MAKVSLSVSAQNTWSSPFHLAGDGAGWPRRALISIVGGSTVTIKRMSGEAVLSSKTMMGSQVLETPVPGEYIIGVATGDYVDATVITVEQ